MPSDDSKDVRRLRDKLRGWLETCFRSVPIARGILAERDYFRAVALAARARATMGKATTLTNADIQERQVLFDWLAKSGQTNLLAEHGGLQFVVNLKDQVISRQLYATGEFEYGKLTRALSILQQLKHPAAKPDLIVDVGANIGSICIPAVAYGLVPRAIAIEPHPENLRLLRANIALNNLSAKINVVAAAVGEAEGSLSLFLSAHNWGDMRVWDEDSGRSRIDVSCVAMDTIVIPARAERPLIWMDVQGYEGQVLTGAMELLRKCPPLVIEFWPWAIERANGREALFRMLLKYPRFVDLADPEIVIRTDLDALWRRIGSNEDRATDILLLGDADAQGSQS